MPEPGTFMDALRRRGDVTCLPMGTPEANSVVRFDQMPDPDAYFARVARKHAVPRRHRRLAERFSKVEYVTDDRELGHALEAMRDMLLRRFDSDLRMFRTESNREFTHNLVEALHDAGHAKVSSLQADGRRITVTVDLRSGQQTFWYAVAYEPDLAEQSLGHLELYEFLHHAYSTGMDKVDLGSAGFAYKQRWANTEDTYSTVAVTAHGLKGAIANNLRRAATKLHRVRQGLHVL